ncbi:uncharacterized protein LOC124126420 [Haliotis rufescens]|uniref:uncharacterized protein LOC124126420 n=1 Tax=Haliotis rufescens TaxID=6454 RepID=UPI00201F3749|nr:uncharacterized protein LOC124126420 [Haliotis rufescens]
MSVLLHSAMLLFFLIALGRWHTTGAVSASTGATRVLCPGQFGPSCSLTCGHCIDGEPCHQDTGVCLRGCQDGFTGHSCKETLDSTSPFQAGLAGGVVMLVVALVIAAIVIGAHYLWKKRQRNIEHGNLESGSLPSKEQVAPRILSLYRKGSNNRNTYVDEEVTKGTRGQKKTEAKRESAMSSTQPKTISLADQPGTTNEDDRDAAKVSRQEKAAPDVGDMYEVPVTPDYLNIDLNMHHAEEGSKDEEYPTQDTDYDVPPPPLPTDPNYLPMGHTEDDAGSMSDDSSYEIPVVSS